MPCVLLKDWQLVKSIKFGSFRTIGHPITTASVYNARNVDELIVLDIDASLKNEPINKEMISDIANKCFMPLTVGGGINNISDIYTVLHAGADKISINSKALEDVKFIERASSIFGSQCIVCSIDVIEKDNKYKVYNKKRGVLDLDPVSLAQIYQERGAGEILLTSVDREGTTLGYDTKLMKLFNNKLEIPVILNGGMGKPIHAVEAIAAGADAVAAAYIFHFSKYTPEDIRIKMAKHNINVRGENCYAKKK